MKVNNVGAESIYILKGDVVVWPNNLFPPLEIIDDVPTHNIFINQIDALPQKLDKIYDDIEENFPDKMLPPDFIETLNVDELKSKGKNFSYRNCAIQHDNISLCEKTLKLLKKYENCFSKNSLDIGCTDLIKAHLEVDESKLKMQKQRPLPLNKLKQLELIVRDMESAGIVQKADGHSLSMVTNVLLVPKTDRTLSTKADKLFLKHQGILPTKFRFCSDLRPLNDALINKTSVAMPSPEQIISKMSNCVISSVDVTQAFFAIKVTEESKKFLGFF